MGKTAYFECYSGISGDMTVAALLDLGADPDKLQKALASLHLDGYSVQIGRANKNGVEAADFDVILEHHHEEEPHHHHHEEEHSHEHHHEEGHHHHHDHDHAHPHVHGHTHGEGHVHRGLKEILPMIDGAAEVSLRAKEMAKQVFTVLAKAEGKVHGKAPEEVHFHEVGAVDSIVDIVAACVCLDDLDIDTIIASPVFEGTGWVKCQHGLVPVPAPATLELVREAGLSLKITGVQGEMVTPTGAAILAALGSGEKLPASFTVEKIGLGAGKKNFDHANVLRVMLIESGKKKTDELTDTVCVLETNIDDCTGEQLAYCREQLMQAGALDVSFFPLFMKKGRPAYGLTVLCQEAEEEALTKVIFRETTAVGLRRSTRERRVMARSFGEVVTEYGPVQVKICEYGEIRKVYVEYESAAALARQTGKSLDEIYRKAYGKLS